MAGSTVASPSICLDVHVSPGSIRRLTFDHSPLTFGRDADNDIVVASRFASRRHGELRYDNGQWWLVNQSANGATINGKRVGKRPRALTEHDVVNIGDQPVFEVRVETQRVAAEAAEQTRPGAVASASSPRKRRVQTYIGMGVFYLFLIGLIIFLATGGDADDPDSVRRLLPAEIEQEIRQPPPDVTPDERAARSHLEQAHELFHRPNAAPDALHKTYEQYRLALAYTGQPRFDQGIDDRRYLEIENQLVKQLTDLYQTGYARLRSSNYEGAEKAFRQLQLAYPVSTSIIFQNAEQQRRVAVKQMKRRR